MTTAVRGSSRFAVSFPDGAPPSTAANLAAFHSSIPPGVSPSTVLSVYPTQLLEVALGFVMFLILWRLRDHKHAEGWLMGVYMVLAGIERFAVEFLRAKDDHLFGPLHHGAVSRHSVRDRGRARHAHARGRARLGARHLRRRVSRLTLTPTRTSHDGSPWISRRHARGRGHTRCEARERRDAAAHSLSRARR